MMPLTEVTREGREGFEVVTLILVSAALIPTVIGQGPPSVIEVLPFPWYVVWALFGIAGCLFSLLGIFLPNRPIGLIMEQAALVPTMICALSYSFILIYHSGWAGALAAAVVAGFAWTCIMRYRRIKKALIKAEVIARQRAVQEKLSKDFGIKSDDQERDSGS